MSQEEQNAPRFFYYLIKWRQHDPQSASGAYEERNVDSGSNLLTIEGQPVYKPYEIYVLAMNEIGEAASAPQLVIGYSGEDGRVSTESHLV